MQVSEKGFSIPTLPGALPPAGNDLVAVAPGRNLFPNASIITSVTEVMNDAELFVQKERSSPFVFAKSDVLRCPQVNHDAWRKRLPWTDNVLAVLPVRIPLDIDSIREVALSDLEKVLDEIGFQDLVRVDCEGVRVALSERRF
jgi:hypothetical protein